MNSGEALLNKIVTLIIDPLILVIFAAGFFFFMWGLVEFLWSMKGGEVQTDGKNHMIWGIVGMLIMVSVYGIIALISNTFGFGINPGGTFELDTSSLNNITAPANFTR